LIIEPDEPVRAGEIAATTAEEPSIYPGHRVLAMFPFYNEEVHIAEMVPRLHDGLVDKIIAINNRSTDSGPEILRQGGIEMLDEPVAGIGACIRMAIEYARKNEYDILVVMAGNNKDNPEEIPMLLEPIVQGRADYVQGSRFMSGGSSANLPLFRLIAIRLLSAVFRVYSGTKCTDLTNGFRAYKVALFDNPEFRIEQSWLNTYEFEYYVHWKVLQCKYRLVEVPVSKTYPAAKNVPYTKVRPFSGWWQMLRPFLFLWLRIKE
jgi:dolichol-phosphate mannosyltransferase